MMNPRKQGDAGEFSAMTWFAFQGASVYVPLGHSPDIDFVALMPSGELKSVQVKTSTCFQKHRWVVSVCTRGGNQSWNGIVKYLDGSRFDYLCVVVGDGRRWVIPAESLEVRAGLVLGGPKYAEWEVEAGPPLDPAGNVSLAPV